MSSKKKNSAILRQSSFFYIQNRHCDERKSFGRNSAPPSALTLSYGVTGAAALHFIYATICLVQRAVIKTELFLHKETWGKFAFQRQTFFKRSNSVVFVKGAR